MSKHIYMYLVWIILMIPGCAWINQYPKEALAESLISIIEIESIKEVEEYLPINADSVIEFYRRYDKRDFKNRYADKIYYVCRFIDSMNSIVDAYWAVDTLSIDHTAENIGTAAVNGKTLYISSCYFFMYRGTEIFKSIITHEYGHIFYSRLTPHEKSCINNTWTEFNKYALIYIFHDGEYSHNARFGGHPEDSPEELFASAYNLFTNRSQELDFKLKYVDDIHLNLINDFKSFIKTVTSKYK